MLLDDEELQQAWISNAKGMLRTLFAFGGVFAGLCLFYLIKPPLSRFRTSLFNIAGIVLGVSRLAQRSQRRKKEALEELVDQRTLELKDAIANAETARKLAENSAKEALEAEARAEEASRAKGAFLANERSILATARLRIEQ